MKPRRSILSVPGHVEKMHARACNSSADVIMLDLEDSVPVDAKPDAPEVVSNSIQTLDWGNKILTVRINGLDTPFAYRDLIAIAEAVGDRIDSVVLPKTDHPGDVHFVSRMLDGIEMQRGFTPRIGIEAIIESARGMSNVSRIAQASDRLRSLVFGIADYSASIRARLVSISGHGEESDIYPGHRWHFEMSRLVMAARANDLRVIDAPYGNFKDSDGLNRACAMTCALGFDGKWAIHPGQIDTINRIFSPSQADIARALKVIAAYENAKNRGRGAAAIDGRMIDGATLRMARQVKAQAEYLGLSALLPKK
ncbi:MAG: CoA ester lyase [Deltaproteobacteria bacterium]|nr:MAG: CoA ester lyase [Deltaproteobacteria bacterium]